jgi:hypothetical protein
MAEPVTAKRGKIFDDFQHLADACRVLTARKDGPSLYDACDPLRCDLCCAPALPSCATRDACTRYAMR